MFLVTFRLSAITICVWNKPCFGVKMTATQSLFFFFTGVTMTKQ